MLQVRKMFVSVIWIALTVYLVVAGFALLVADRILFQPPKAGYGSNALPIAFVRSGGDSIAVLHIAHPNARYTILYSHGNAEDLGSVSYTLRELSALGFNVIGYDYRGYGLSTGGPATAVKAARDIEAVYDYVVSALAISPQHLILYGRSVGSGPTMELAAKRRVAGVILESPFTSAFRVVTHVRLLPFDRFPNLGYAGKVKVPILIMHGTRDAEIPFAHSQRLFAAANDPKQALWVDGAGHEDVAERAGARYAAALQNFVRLVDAQ